MNKQRGVMHFGLLNDHLCKVLDLRRSWRIGLTLFAVFATLMSSGCVGNHQFGRQPVEPAIVFRADQTDGAHYTVHEGDVLGRIAVLHDISLGALAAANDLAPPYRIYPGDTLSIPQSAASASVHASSSRPPKSMAPSQPNTDVVSNQLPIAVSLEPQRQGARYVVGAGESLATIASRYDLSLGDLVAANDIDAPYRIFPGEVLIVPPSEDMLQERARRPNEIRKQHVTEAPVPPLSSDGFRWPVQGPVVRTFKQNSAAGESGAINIAAPVGTVVRATNNGVVAFAGEALQRYGRMVMVRHANGYLSLYAHNRELLVKEGDAVYGGQAIAEVGNSGDVAEGQLRFELRKRMEPIDPERVLAGTMIIL